MNEVLKLFLGQFFVIYFNDILLFNNSLKEHLEHLTKIFEALNKNKLYINLPKCEFTTSSVHFLGYIILNQGIHMDPCKVNDIISWPTPTSIRDICSFHGLANFYWHFIQGFNTIMAHLTDCMKEKEFHWGPTQMRNLKKNQTSSQYNVAASTP